LSPVVSVAFIKVSAKLDAFGNPSLLVKVRHLHRLIADLRIKEKINWAPVIDFVPIEQCTTPKRHSFEVVTKGVAKGRLNNLFGAGIIFFLNFSTPCI